MPEQILSLSTKIVHEDPENPRTRWGDMEDLAARIRAKGKVIEPIVVHAHPTKPGHYEIEHGARRKRATEMAGLDAIDAIVREKGTRASLRIDQVNDNKAEPLSPMDEGLAFRKLEAEDRLSITDIADRAGVPAATVSARMKLTRLVPALRALLDVERIGQTSAQTLAMLSEDVQELVAEDAARLHPRDHITGADVKRLIDRHVRVLDAAPFNGEDETLVLGSPRCSMCPSNTSIQREMFGDLAGLCTNAAGWASKVDAEWQRKIDAAGTLKVKVFTPEEVGVTIEGSRVRPGARWVDVDLPIDVDTEETWSDREKALASSSVDGVGFDAAKLAIARNGDVFIRLLDSIYAANFIAKEKPDRARELRGEKNPEVVAEAEERARKKAKAAIDLEARKRSMGPLVEALTGNEISAANLTKASRLCVLLALEAAGPATCGEVARRRELQLDEEHGREIAPREALTRAAADMDERDLFALLAEVLVVRSLTDEHSLGKVAHELLELAGVSLKKLTKEIEREGRGVKTGRKKKGLPVVAEQAASGAAE